MDKKFKILLVSNMYPSKKDVFHGIFVKNFTEEMMHYNVRINLSVIKGKGAGKLEKVLKYLTFIFKTFYKVIFEDYDVVYIHFATYSSLALLPLYKLIRKPIVVNVHGSDILPTTSFSRFLFKLTYNLVKKSSMIVVPSNYFKNVVIEKYNHPNIFISPSGGVNTDIFKPSLQSNKNNVFTLGYIGRIEDQKGWDILLSAVKMLKDHSILVNLIIIGSGKQENEMKELISKFKLSKYITLYGSIAQNKLPELISTFDLFCFPTMREAESLGLVGLEAMSCGVPVLGSNIGGLMDYIIDGKNGYLVNPGTSDEIFKKIIEFKNLKTTKQELMKIAALEMAKQYDSKVVASNLLNKLKDIAK